MLDPGVAGHVPGTFTDPVCGMMVAADSPHTAEHAGQPFKFCCAGCRTKFLNDPTRYVAATTPLEGTLQPAPAAQPSSGVAAGTPYTARCTLKSDRSGPGIVRSAAWRSSP
jgi:P-type Cu+ transporter